ncbi:unnamed protein product [Ambrosiozyma monospora]|uniref:Unnamed protein product n=1 Tax=Ambrosiozyma monospora TaxID=43982 RepID=A0ACB5SYJ3_AMBMO|nr:unnamed protein product [Ambrosiozyma monospora]
MVSITSLLLLAVCFKQQVNALSPTPSPTTAVETSSQNTWYFGTTVGCSVCHEPCSVDSYACYGTICTHGTTTLTTTQNYDIGTTVEYAASCYTGGLTFPTGTPAPQPTQSLVYDWSFESESCYSPCGPCQTETYFCQDDLCSLSFIPKTVTQTSPYVPTTTFSKGTQCNSNFVTPPAQTTGPEKWPYSYHLFYNYDCSLPCGPCSTALVQCSNTQCSYDGSTFYGEPAGDDTLKTPSSCPKSTYHPSTSVQPTLSA